MRSDETLILASRRQTGSSVPAAIDRSDHGNRPLKNFVITRNMVTDTVFGMGYKSLPTYTLEDFYIMQVEQGQVPYPKDEEP